MDDVDVRVLDRLQSDFPITAKPFALLAEDLSLSEAELVDRIKVLKDQGIIRRLGAIFDSKKLGYSSTLMAAHVPEERVEQVAELINEFNEVTHNYLRNHHYNVWFTVIAPSPEHIECIAEEIKVRAGISELLNLPAVNLFKIKVHFELGEVSDGAG